jgi:hypothetical protein
MGELSTTSLPELIARSQAGENSALDSLIRRTQELRERFARRMLAGFPVVRATRRHRGAASRAKNEDGLPASATFFAVATHRA